MKKKTIPVEFVYQLFALIIAIIVVHAFYVSIVRPNATEALEQQAIEAASNPDYVRERSTWVLIKDLEQESCFVLMFWALAIMGYKTRNILRERDLLDTDLVPIAEGMRILPEDTQRIERAVSIYRQTGKTLSEFIKIEILAPNFEACFLLTFISHSIPGAGKLASIFTRPG